MAGLLRKRLTYRSQIPVDLLEHSEHWATFIWQSGPVQVRSYGPWGQIQVWAASEAEGKRVIRHAAAISGFDPDTDPAAEWVVSSVGPGRIGRVAPMRVIQGQDGIMVTSREGPSGLPNTF
jgi:hypothetical protein